jgi:hypothetical protein
MWGNGGSRLRAQSENGRHTDERHHSIFISSLSACGWNPKVVTARKPALYLPKWLQNSGSEARI